MKKSFMICLAIAGATFANACTDNAIDYGCKEGATECNNGNIYTCEKGIKGTYWKETKCDFGCFENNGIAKCYECDLNDGDKLQKCENSIIYKCEKSSDSNSNKGTWKPLETCVNRCDNNTDIFKSKCQCRDGCVNGCTTNGSCLPVDKCSKTDETGACISCVNGVDNEKGTCIYPACVLNNDDNKLDDGKCPPVEQCDQTDETGACICANELNHNLNGTCDCSEFCIHGCDANGNCEPASESCEYNHDVYGNCICQNNLNNKPDGTCDCSEFCVHGCDANGNCEPAIEACRFNHDINGNCICLNGNLSDGSCKNVCQDGSTFNPSNGLCSCSEACDSKCYPDGSCITATSCKDDAECKEKYDYCDGTSRNKICYCDKQNNYCSPIDMNHNNMKDQVEHLSWNTIDCFYDAETGKTIGNRAKQDEYCKFQVEKLEANESSKLNPAQSFCDSFIDYHCALKCSSDEQCLEGFICREDGRCAADSFTTVWDNKSRERELAFIVSKKNVGIYICWDWNEIKEGDDYCTLEECFCQTEGCKFKEFDKFTKPTDDELQYYPEFKTAKCPVPFQYINQADDYYKEKSRYIIKHDYSDTNVKSSIYQSTSSSDITIKVYGKVNDLSIESTEYRFCQITGAARHVLSCSHLDVDNHLDNCRCFDFNEVKDNSILYNDAGYIGAIEANHAGCLKGEANSWDGTCIENDYIDKTTKKNIYVSCDRKDCSDILHYDGSCKNCLIDLKNTPSYYLREVVSFGRVGLGSHKQDTSDKYKDYYEVDHYRGAFNNAPLLTKLSSIDIPDPSQLDMTAIFKNACSLNHPLQNWDVSQVISMKHAFNMTECQPAKDTGSFVIPIHPAFNHPLEKWDVSSVKNMAFSFECLASFDQPLNDWDVKNVTTMSNMFGCPDTSPIFSGFNHELSNWTVSSVIGFTNMFENAKYFNQDLSKWSVSKAKSMENMFRGASSFNQNLSSWNVQGKVTANMFTGTPMETFCAYLPKGITCN